MKKETYDPDVLRKLQLVELDILKDFICICKKYNLEYFATGGTAIGALRHKGFIPWDDDIDVCMLRDDYNQFMKVAPLEFGNKYIFMDANTESAYPLMFGKMIKKGTRFIEADYQQANYPLGIFIDIFPYDKTPMDFKQRKKIIRKTWRIARMHVLTLMNNPNLPDSCTGIPKKIVEVLCKIIHIILKLFHITPQKTYKNYLKWATSCPETSSDLYIDYSYITGENLMIQSKTSFPTIEVPFEDITISLVRDYDRFLRLEYGDYMELPPEEKRHNHVCSYIDFGDN